MSVLLGVSVSFVGRAHWGKRDGGFGFFVLFLKFMCPLTKGI